MKTQTNFKSYLTRLRGQMLNLGYHSVVTQPSRCGLHRTLSMILLLLCLGATNVWGATATLPNNQAITTTYANVGSDSNVKIKTSSANNYTNPLRFYANNTITIQVASGYKINSVTYEASSTGNYVTYAQNATVSPNVTPSVSGKNVTWTFSSETTEFTFKPGTQTRANSITITYEEAAASKTLSSISITTQPTKRKYVAGETFSSAGAVVRATYSDASTANVTATWTPTAALTASIGQTVTATYTEGDVTKTATTTIDVYAVTMQARDEDGNAIAAGGPGAPTRTGTSISPAADAGKYVFKEWQISGATLGSSATTKSNTITSPTGAVTVTAVYYKPITITYKANGSTFTTQTYGRGGTLAFPASNPDGATYSCTGKTFVGWVSEANKDYSNASTPPTYSTAGGSVTTAATYYAVFATASVGGGTSTVSDVLTRATTGISNGSSTYSAWEGKTVTSDAVYAGNSAGSNNAIQLRSNNSNSGVVTTASGGKAKKVTVTWKSNTSASRTINIYGKNTAYSAATDLYNSSSYGTLLGSICVDDGTELSITGDYEYIGIRSASGALYLTNITIDWSVSGGTTYSNYETNCCTPLGQINGSINLTQSGSSITVSGWAYTKGDAAAESNINTYDVYLYSEDYSYAAHVQTQTCAYNSKSVTFTGLTLNKQYKIKIGATGKTNYCDITPVDITTINSHDASTVPFKFAYSIYIDDGTNDNYSHNYITASTTNHGTVTINKGVLNSAPGYYQFKVAGFYDSFWGGQSGTSEIPSGTEWTCDNNTNNIRLRPNIGGNYVFNIDYSGTPKVTVTFPTATQAANNKIWLDNSILNWSVMWYRVGNTSQNKTSNSFTLVPGTDKFYVVNTLNQSMEAWQLANNCSWSGDNSIYKVDGSGYAITKGTEFQKYVVESAGVTIIPNTPSTGQSDGCDYYAVTKTDGMLTHTATITTPSNGTISLAYTSKSGSPSTATVSDLPHRSYITATATPAAGYQLTTFTVTPEGGAATSLVATNGNANNHVLATNATFAATFSAKTITITWNGNGGTPSKASDTWVYNSSALASLPTASGNGSKIFAGWFTDPTAGTQIDNVGGSNKPTDNVTYYAHWSDGNTVYFNASPGTASVPSVTQTTIGGTVTLATATIDCEGWSFAGWKVGSAQEETTTNPEAGLLAGGASYTPESATVQMYAVWKKNFGGGTGDVTSTYDWDSNTTGWTTAGTTQNSGGVDNSKYANLGGTGYMTYNSQVKVKGLSFAFKLSSNNTKGTIKVQKATNSTFSSGLTDVRTWTISQMSASSSSWTTYSTEVSDFDGATNCYVRLAYIQEGNSTVARYFDDIVVTYTGTIPDSYKWTSTPEDYGCVPANQVKTPVITPSTEAQTGDVSVSITCATDGATIKYTTDGTTPSSSNGTTYSAPFTVSCSSTVKAIAYKATMDDSEIAEQEYTVTVPTPTFNLPAGTYYDANQSVTLSLPTAHTGTVIKYTTNGDDPTSSSETYLSAITVTEGTTTIKAIGYNSTCGTSSSVASATYIVRFGTDYTLVTDANDLMAGDQVVMISADAGTSSKYAISTTISSNKRTSTSDYNINAGLTTAKIYPAVGAAATVQVFTLGGEPGAWTFHETTNNGYLNCPSAGKLTNTATVSNSNKWTIAIASNIATIHNNEVDATIKSNTAAGHVFAAYAPATENVQLVKLYSIPNPNPVIKIEADLSTFSACRGSASDYQSFYISGKNLDGSIVLSNVAPLAGYEFCLTSGGTYTATLELTPVSKTVAKRQVFVRLAAGATAGTKNGNLNAAVSANSLSTNIAVSGTVSVADTYTDQIHGQVIANQCGTYYAPSCSDTSAPGAATDCTTTHYRFMGWITEADRNASGVKDDAWYIAHLITAGTSMTADGTNYYAVWAKEED